MSERDGFRGSVLNQWANEVVPGVVLTFKSLHDECLLCRESYQRAGRTSTYTSDLGCRSKPAPANEHDRVSARMPDVSKDGL